MTTNPDFIVTFDGGKAMMQTLGDVFKWRDWKPWEKKVIQGVLAGDIRRFSTSKDGVYCDIERRET